MNNDLTVLLLLKGRYDFTIRWFEYAEEYSIPYRVLIADGGQDECLENKLGQRKFSQHIDYEYIRYPHDENYKTYFTKVLDALTRVETPFVVLASDDDFYFFDALEASVRFLKENPEFVASRGEIWDFNVSKRSVRRRFGVDNHVYGDMGGIRRLYDQPTVVGGSAIERVTDFSSKYHSVWHEVVRTERLKEAWSALLESAINDIRFSEAFTSFFAAISGNIRRGDELYMLHQVHPDMLASTILGDTAADWISGDEWKTNFEKFVKGVAEQISDAGGIELSEAKCAVIESYLVNIVIGRMLKTPPSQVTEQTIKTHMTEIAKNVLRRNRFILNAARRIASSFSKSPTGDPVPSHFGNKVEVIREFLKNSYHR